MWDILLQNLPTIILAIIVVIICGAEIIKALRVWREEKTNRINQQIEEQNQEQAQQNAMTELSLKMDLILEKLGSIEERLQKAENRLDKLTESDMHDIKAWIVDQYHKFFVGQGWIDAFSAETLDRRYEDYKDEGGNSYIDNLMAQLHTLSMDPENRNQ
jgi:hypothetical protein